MKLLFKQRLFSWFDSYDIYDEAGRTVYTVEGQLAWGHLLKIFDPQGRELGTVKQRLMTFLPQFELYVGPQYAGRVTKELSLFRPKFRIDCNGWTVDGNVWEWEYTIFDRPGRRVATVSKQLLNWTDTYVMDIDRPEDALCVLMLVLAIDAEKCSRNGRT